LTGAGLLNVVNLISEVGFNFSGLEKDEKEGLTGPEQGLGFTEYLEINSSILGL